MKIRSLRQIIMFSIFGLALLLTLGTLFLILFFIFQRGLGVISWEFLTAAPRDGMTAGGIFPALVGSVYLVLGAILFSAPLGVLAAVFLTEYARQSTFIRLIRIGVNNLAGVPSVVLVSLAWPSLLNISTSEFPFFPVL